MGLADRRNRQDDADIDGPVEAAATSGPAAVESVVASGDTAAPSAISQHLDEALSGAGARDILAEDVAPATRPLEEQASAGDPTLPDDHPKPTPTAAATGDTVVPAADAGHDARIENAGGPAADQGAPTDQAAPASEAGGAQSAAEKEESEEDKELRRLGLDAEALRALGGLAPEARTSFFAEMKGRRAASETAKKRIELLKEQDKQQKRQSAGAGGLLGALVSALKPNFEIMAAKREAREHTKALSPEMVRDRIASLRREEILQHATTLTDLQTQMKASAKRYNEAFFATETGKAIEQAAIRAQAQRPDLTPAQIAVLARDGALPFASEISPELVRQAAAEGPVKAAGAEFEALSERVNVETKGLTEKMAAFEEHMPGHSDTGKTREALDDMFKGFEETFAEPILDEETATKLKERLAEIAKSVQEFMGRMLAALGMR